MATNLDASIETLTDIDWIANSLLYAMPKTQQKKEVEYWRRYSDADLAYVGTGLGQNVILNPLPQFTPLADIPRRGIWSEAAPPGMNMGKGTHIKHSALQRMLTGIGRCYYEAVDMNQQHINIRFGTIVYKGLFTFFTSFYDNDSANLARHGRVPLSYYAGLAVGTLATLPLAPLILAGRVWSWFIDRTSSRYMDLKPAMALFWTRMQVIYNTLGANLGIIARTAENAGHYGKGKDTPASLNEDKETPSYTEYMHKLMPDIFEKSGMVNIHSVSTGGARRAIDHRAAIQQQMAAATSPADLRKRLMDLSSRPFLTTTPAVGLEYYLKEYHTSILGDISKIGKETDEVESATSQAIDAAANGDPTALQRLRDLAGGNQATGDGSGAGIAGTSSLTDEVVADMTGQGVSSSLMPGEPSTTISDVSPTGTATGAPVAEPVAAESPGISARDSFKTVAVESSDGEANIIDRIQGWFADAGKHYQLEYQQGSAFLNLGVSYVGSGTTTLANTLKETVISGTANSLSAGARDSRISLSDYNTGFGFIDGAMNMVRGLIGGGLDGIQMSGLMALAGNAFIDFPKQWDTSSVTLPTSTFKIELRAVYGNPLYAYLHQFPTIAALLAAAVPPSTGPQSYTSPLVCECYCRGFASIRLGMITDLSITAAAGSLGYDDNWRPLDYELTFTVTDFSSVMHATISNGFNPLKPWRRVFDDDSVFGDTLSSFTGMSMRDMVDPTRKFSIRWAARMQDYKAFFSPEHFASVLADRGSVRTLNKIFGSVAYPGT